jgi:hypothetical protein
VVAKGILDDHPRKLVVKAERLREIWRLLYEVAVMGGLLSSPIDLTKTPFLSAEVLHSPEIRGINQSFIPLISSPTIEHTTLNPKAWTDIERGNRFVARCSENRAHSAITQL